MNAAIAGMAIQALGGLFGGMSRNNAARKLTNRVVGEATQRIQLASQDHDINAAAAAADQARAIDYRASDEARMKAATGYDFQKLRADAEAAGFNPLTVLQATGGMGYDGRGAILTTPFIATPQRRLADYDNTAELLAGVGQTQVQTAGYFGDALAGVGAGITGLSEAQAQRDHEMRMLQLQMDGVSNARRLGGGYTTGGGYGGSPMVTSNKVTASPVETYTGFSWGGVKDWFGNVLTGGRPERKDPQANISGTMTIENPLFGGRVYVGGSDGDVMGVSELVAVAVQAAPQVAINWATKVGTGFATAPKTSPKEDWGGGAIFQGWSNPFKGIVGWGDVKQ